MREIVLESEGLLNGSSAPARQSFLERQEGIHRAEVNPVIGTTTVEFDEKRRCQPMTCLTYERWSFATTAFLSLFMVLASGCGDKGSIPAMGKVSSVRSAPVDGFPPHEHDTIDAPKGVWDARAVRGALKAAGLGPVSDEGLVRLPFLGPDGTRLAVPGAEIQVYAYADAVARARETDLIDSLKVAPANGHVDWRMPASIIVTNNAALIVLTSDNVLRKRIHAAIRLHEMKQIR